MSKIVKLPVSKDINWGPALNSYLSQMENRINSIEGQIASSSTDTSKFGISNATYVGSGWHTIENDIIGNWLNNNTLKVEVSGVAYYGGASITAITYSKNNYTTTIVDDKAYFIYLKYENEDSSLIASSEYYYGLNYILVGFAKKQQFIPFYQTSTQSQFQQKYDLDHIWGDMNDLFVNVAVDNDGSIKVSTATNSKYVINGLYLTKKLFTLNNTNEKLEINVSAKNASPLYESINASNAPELLTSGTYDGGINKNKDRYGRILVDIFGDVYVQYPNISVDSVLNWQIVDNNQPYYVAVNNQLYNLSFYSINDESFGYRPNMMLEVGRFAIIGGTVNVIYSQKGSATDKIFFAKALNAGVMYQQSQNAWISNTGDVALSSLLFRNVNDGYPFKLKYNQATALENYPSFTIDRNKALDNNATFLFERHSTSSDIKLEKNGKSYLELGDNVKLQKNDNAYLELSNNIKLQTNNNAYLELGDNVKLQKDDNVCLELGDNSTFKSDNITIGNTEKVVGEDYFYNSIILSSSKRSEPGESKYSAGVINLNSFSTVIDTGSPLKQSVDYITLGSLKNDGTKDSLISIHSDGKISLTVGTNSSSKLELNNNIVISSPNLIKCSSIEMQLGSSITYLSDRRCKENIVNLKFNYLDTILNTPIVHYNYLNDNVNQIGIIAQDLEDNLPANQDVFIRKTNDDGLKNRRSIAETKLVYILWKGLQEETQARRKLEKELTELKNKIK